MKILMFVGGVILFMMIEEESGAHIGNFLWGGGVNLPSITKNGIKRWDQVNFVGLQLV